MFEVVGVLTFNVRYSGEVTPPPVCRFIVRNTVSDMKSMKKWMPDLDKRYCQTPIIIQEVMSLHVA